jgi:error-prone DNA polymerase
MGYAELTARSCFSLLEGASQPHELVESAAARGCEHLAVTDRDCVYGVVQAHKEARDRSVHLVLGAIVTVRDRPSVTVHVRDARGWASLCRLLTAGRWGETKGRGRVPLEELLGHSEGLSVLLRRGWSEGAARPLLDAFGDRVAVGVSKSLSPSDRVRVREAVALSKALGRPLLATNDVLFHDRERQMLADVLTCIRRRTSLAAAGRALAPNGERLLLPEGAFRARYDGLEGSVEGAVAWAEACTFSLEELRYSYPREVVPEGSTPMAWLVELTEAGLAWRYPEGVPATVRAQVAHELEIIEELDFPSYFLTVYDVVRFARSKGILCQGRGSAANSAVCYALGVTSVDPARTQLLFERFISRERGEPPDIDVDFEHERREEVIQYVYERYGRLRAGMVNEFICYRQRSAIRDVGKVFGLSLDQVDRLAKGLDRWAAGMVPTPEDASAAQGRTLQKWSQPHEGGRLPTVAPSITRPEIAQLVRETGLDPTSPEVRSTLAVSAQLAGFPRHLSIHVGGFVIAADQLVDLVPIEPASMEGRTVIQWDKYDVDALRFVKVDLLALGMLTAIRKAFDLVEGFGGPSLSLATVPSEDPAVYDMFCKADTVGVFQIESRAQMSMLPRLKPRCFYDLVIEVAIVRPGPIQGGMVHPYLRRRSGEEPVTYAHEALVPILERTLGVPLFQEQVMAMAVAVGGFSAGKADRLRRAMGAWRKRGNLREMGEELVEGMVERGIERSYAEAVFAQILGFGEYGFPESHAASFALLVYVSGWLKCHHPAAFCAALINAQPMGFYSPRALVADAQRHGVEVRPVCVTASHYDCTLEPGPDGAPAIRLGLRLVQGFGQADGEALQGARDEAPFRSLADLAHRTGLDRRKLQTLAEAGAFEAVARGRRAAAWSLQGLYTDLPLFAAMEPTEPTPALPEASVVERLQSDYRTVGLSVDLHPMQLVREPLEALGCLPLSELSRRRPGDRVRIAGLVSSRQRPGTASGVVFMTFEDETAMANLVIWPKVWATYQRMARHRSLLGCDGTLQRQDDAVSVLVERFWEVPEPPESWSAPGSDEARRFAELPVRSHDFH